MSRLPIMSDVYAFSTSRLTWARISSSVSFSFFFFCQLMMLDLSSTSTLQKQAVHIMQMSSYEFPWNAEQNWGKPLKCHFK